MVLALSDAAIGGAFGLAGVLVTTGGIILVALLTRTTKATAKTAASNADAALDVVARLLDREGDCLKVLGEMHKRLVRYEQHAGLPLTPTPPTLLAARRHQAEAEAALEKHHGH